MPTPNSVLACPPPHVHEPPSSSQRRTSSRRSLLVLAGSQVLGGIGGMTGTSVSGLVVAGLSGSAAMGGLAVGAVVVGAAAASLLIGHIAARADRRLALVLGYLAGAAGATVAAGAAAVGSWPLLLAALVPFGAATAAGLATRFAAAELAPPHARGRAIGIVMWATTAGAVLGPNLAAPAHRVAAAAGLVPAAGPFVLCTAAFGTAAAVLWSGLRPAPPPLAPPIPGDAGGARSAWRVLWSCQPARRALAGLVLVQVVMVGLMSMTPVHLGHADLHLVGAVISVHVAGMFVAAPLWGWLADRAGPDRVLAGAYTLMLSAAVLCAVADRHDTALLGAGLALLGLGWSAGLVAGSKLLTESLPATARPAAQAVTDATMNLAGAAGGIGAGAVFALGTFTLLGAVAAAVVLPYVLVAGAASVRRRKPSGAVRG